MVVAIVGGTNIGKSVIFNHLAGEVASASSPLAAGTKHPVCLVPPDLADPDLLQRLFEPFALCAWRSPDDPLDDTSENRLYWRVGPTMPPRLLLLDAPDVDSNVTVNWQRARAIRQTADVLVAVLTQQKYNDAAVKQFFRAAVEAQKPIVVVFNQCDAADRDYWPRWLATFCQHTGARPDWPMWCRTIARRPKSCGCRFTRWNRLLKQRRDWPLKRPALRVIFRPRGLVASATSSASASATGFPLRESNLRDDLAALLFDAIKIQTFRGALGRVLDPQHGLPAYLHSIRAAAAEFSAAAAALSATEMARVGWPSLPAGVLVEEIARWWNDSRQEWSRRIHGFYRVLGRGVTWPVRTAWNVWAGPPSDAIAAFQQQERAAIVLAVEKLLDELDRLAEVGNDTLRPRLQRLLGGHARAALLARVQSAHESLPAVDEHYRAFLRAELDGWRRSNPRAVRFLQSLDHAAALARPVITVALFFTGLHFAGDLVGQAAAQAASSTAGHLATEAAIAGGITGGGEALVGSTSEGVRQAAGRLFGRLQSRYAQQRAGWLAEWLERELLGDLLADLRRGADLPGRKEFREVETAVTALMMGRKRSDNARLHEAVATLARSAIHIPHSSFLTETVLPVGNVGKFGRTAPLPLAVAIAPIGRREVLGQLAAAGQLEQGLQVEHFAPRDVARRIGRDQGVEIGHDRSHLLLGRQLGPPGPVVGPTVQQPLAAAEFRGECRAQRLAARSGAEVCRQVQVELRIARAPFADQLANHGIAVGRRQTADDFRLGLLRRGGGADAIQGPLPLERPAVDVSRYAASNGAQQQQNQQNSPETHALSIARTARGKDGCDVTVAPERRCPSTPQEKIPTRLPRGRATCLGTLLGPRREAAKGPRSCKTSASGKRAVENIHRLYDRVILLMLE